MTSSLTDPVPADRIAAIDAVRGVAVMGILLLNIIGFGMPAAAYTNPLAFGADGPADIAVYLVNFILFDGKMRGLFSFLFGASTLLVIERAEAAGLDPARVHFARMGWLLVFGLAHLWLIWWGDILSHYALVGMIAFACRDLPIERLIGFGVVLLLAQCAIVAGLPVAIHQATLDAAGAHPAAALRTLADFRQNFGVPPPDKIAADLALYRDGYIGLVRHRLAHNWADPLSVLYFAGCETLAYMLFGMAALRSGMLSGAWPRRRYLRWCLIGFAIGIPGYAAIAVWLVSQHFSMFAVATGVVALTVPVRPPMILGWACLILLLIRPGGWLTTRVAAAGRMAFSNYLGTSLICTTVFYGYGLGWYGHLSRAQLYLVIPFVWLAMLLWSKPWLDHFRYGPLEWLWRSLARGKLQPFRGGAVSASASQ